MSDTTYNAVVEEVAIDLQLDATELRSWFSRYLNSMWPHEGIPAEWAGACYAVYRLTKARDAFRMVSTSRTRWRECAIELGAPPYLHSKLRIS